MHIRTILNKCEKFKSFLYKKITFVNYGTYEAIEIELVPRMNSKPVCSNCKNKSSTYDHLKVRKFDFIPLWGYKTYFIYRMRRVNCKDCGVKVESVPWGSGNYASTKSYMIFLSQWAKVLSWSEAARIFRTSWNNIYQSVSFVVEYGLKYRNLDDISAIGVDEISLQKGHKYLTVVYQIDKHCSRLLWIGKERTTKTLLKFFRKFGKEFTSNLKFICSDMWRPYLKVIKKKAPQALHILDRFHIMQKFNKAIDEVRAGEHKRLINDGFEPVLKNTRWCLVKRKENLTNKQEATLNQLLKYNLQSVKAYLLKEDFQGFWEYVSVSWAGKFLDRWCNRTMRSKIEPMKKIAKTLRAHKPLILNWFKAKKAYNSGIVEGFNNKAKSVTKKAYGFRTYHVAEVQLYHVLGLLPIPPTTHSYF